MKRFMILLAALAIGLAIADQAMAQLQFHQMINGVATYKDVSTGRFWTATLGRVESRTGAVDAPALVAAKLPAAPLGAANWRLPSFNELAHMYNNSRGGPTVGFHHGLFDYYETIDADILANAFGNGIRTPQKRVGVGHNWVIATWP